METWQQRRRSFRNMVFNASCMSKKEAMRCRSSTSARMRSLRWSYCQDFCIQPRLACPLSGNLSSRSSSLDHSWLWRLLQCLRLVCHSCFGASASLLIQTWRSLAWEAFDLVLKTHFGVLCWRTIPVNGDITRWLVSNIPYFHLYLGKIPFWTHLFQMGRKKPPTR